MTKPRPLPAPTGHAISLTHAAFFHARVGDAPALCCVLDRGVSADARNERGQTLLHIACSNRRFDAARLLLERGADPESRSQLGFTPLTTAAVDADDRLTTLLLDHGADPDGTGPEGLTALMLAAMLDRVELVALLLERGASLELALADGSTALSMALRVDAHCAAQLLLAMSSVNNSSPQCSPVLFPEECSQGEGGRDRQGDSNADDQSQVLEARPFVRRRTLAFERRRERRPREPFPDE